MIITFFSNFMNHHQYPWCRSMSELPDVEFKFVATEPVPKDRLALGYSDMNQESIVIRAYENDEQMELAKKLCYISDVVITGSAPEIYAKIRLENNLLLFRYSERIFRKSRFQCYSPRAIKRMWQLHGRYKQKKVFMLCSSAYTAADFNRMGAYKNKTYKWGYFPKVKEYSNYELLTNKKKRNSILWVARFLELKHPEYVIEVAKNLRNKGLCFEINMIGIGPEKVKIEELIQKEGLEEYVNLMGAMCPEKVRENMEQSEIFLFTSDFREGWGAVLNEAMNSGCAVVASHAIGAAPFLIENGKNGYIYENHNVNELSQKVICLLENHSLRKQMQYNAYRTMTDEWNPRIAAHRFVELALSLMKEDECDLYEKGPCSHAPKLKNDWYKGRN